MNTLSLHTAGLNTIEFLALSAIVLVASVIRGYAGFGFSAIVVAASSLFLPTHEVVPLVLLLEVTASLQMARQVWRDINWRMVLFILAGSFLFIPPGQYLLLWLPIEPMRGIAALLLLTAVILTAAGKTVPIKNQPGGWFVIGTISGFMNGLLAMGGMWAIIFLLGSGIRVAAIRASLVALFFATDSYAVMTGAGQGLVGRVVLVRFIWVVPALLFGVWAGSRTFDADNSRRYKNVVLTVLAILAVILFCRAIWGIAAA